MRAISMPFQALAPQSATPSSAARTASSRASASGATCTNVATARAPPADRGSFQYPIDLAIQPDRIVQQQIPAAADLDQIAQPRRDHPLAHRRPAKHQHLDAEEPGAGRHIDHQPPIERATIEQDRLLRQPFRRRIGSDLPAVVRTTDGALSGNAR